MYWCNVRDSSIIVSYFVCCPLYLKYCFFCNIMVDFDLCVPAPWLLIGFLCFNAHRLDVWCAMCACTHNIIASNGDYDSLSFLQREASDRVGRVVTRGTNTDLTKTSSVRLLFVSLFLWYFFVSLKVKIYFKQWR